MAKAQAHKTLAEHNAYETLAVQPLSLAGLADADRALVVISALADHAGKEHVVSRFGDWQWDLRSLIRSDNRPEAEQILKWPLDVDCRLVNDAKAALYCWSIRGRSSYEKAGPGTLIRCLQAGLPFFRWLSAFGITTFAGVKPIHVNNYIHHCKTELALGPDALRDRLQLIDILWAFREETRHPMAFYPWGKTSLHAVAGTTSLGTKQSPQGVGRTPAIPKEVRATLFRYCEDVMAGADELFAARDTGELSPWDDRLLRVRDAGLFLVSIASGMRNQEVTGIENNSWRVEVKDGVRYAWVTTVEHKTGKGAVEYLIPEQICGVLEKLQRFAAPYQQRLAEEIALLEQEGRGRGHVQRLQRVRRARLSLKKLFLSENSVEGDGTSDRQRRVGVLTRAGCGRALKRLTRDTGSDWAIAPHQCRKTYARMFVESRMGKTSLIFLKWQFKHSSMSMTQLYAANPLQDPALYDEIFDELTELKSELLESWLDDAPLSGGAGRRVIELRAIPIVDREALLRHTAQTVHIRATGHSWCLAAERGCGGAGLYEATRCIDCKDGVIDPDFIPVWQGIYEQQLELLDVRDAGPAVHQRAIRDANRSRRVLEELGVAVPSEGVAAQ